MMISRDKKNSVYPVLQGGLLGRDGGGGGVQARRVPHGGAQHGKRKGLHQRVIKFK